MWVTSPHISTITKLDFKNEIDLNWKKPLFYLLLPVFFIMVFLGFPTPVAPPPKTKEKQEQATSAHEESKRVEL
jgi:hypothetical protein